MPEQLPSVHSATHNLPSAFSYSLCQPDHSKSCGACCGLYNLEDHSRATLEPLLRRRTSLYPTLREDPRRFQEVCSPEAFPPNPKLLETIYNCEFLGWLYFKNLLEKIGLQADIIHCDLTLGRPGTAQFTFENSAYLYSPRHRWCYFSNMTRDDPAFGMAQALPRLGRNGQAALCGPDYARPGQNGSASPAWPHGHHGG